MSVVAVVRDKYVDMKVGLNVMYVNVRNAQKRMKLQVMNEIG